MPYDDTCMPCGVPVCVVKGLQCCSNALKFHEKRQRETSFCFSPYIRKIAGKRMAFDLTFF